MECHRWKNAGLAVGSFGASTITTNLTNNYVDNYNKPPELGIRSSSERNDFGSSFNFRINGVAQNEPVVKPSIDDGNDDKGGSVSSLVTNSTFVGIGFALGKFENKVEKVGDLRNFKIQNYYPSNKYDFITTSSGISDGKIYIEGTKSSTNNLKYVKGAVKYVGYGASAFGLLMSINDYSQNQISGSVLLSDIGMTGMSYAGPYGAGISAFYFMGIRNPPHYFNHKIIDFYELRRVQIDNTRVRN